jgi:hypothetical protein
MLTRKLRRSLQREEGQALVLACLTVLVLSVAVITTVNIGHTVHEKVRLQNTADAAAYSMAAMEARAFNFYAFTNRTQASHYVNAMIWQSIISFVYFMEAFLTDLYGMLRTLSPCMPPRDGTFWQVACPIAEAVPYLGPVIRIINRALGFIRTGVRTLQRTVFRPSENLLDRAVGRVIIPGHRLLNSALASASTVMTAATMSHLVSTSFEVIEANDANVNYNLGSIGAGLLAACMFNRTHYRGMPRTPNRMFQPLDPRLRADNNKIARAKRVMGQVANASRYACAQRGACPELFVTSRTFMDTLQVPDWLRQVGRVFRLDDGPISKWGQTRLLSYQRGWGREVTGRPNTPTASNFIHTNTPLFNTGNGVLGQGDNLGADDLYQIKLGPAQLDLLGIVTVDNPFACKGTDNPMVCHGENRYDEGPSNNKKYGRMLKTSVWASNPYEGFRDDGGIHWRLQYNEPNTTCRQASCGHVPARAYDRRLRPRGTHVDAEMGLNQIDFRVVDVVAITVDIDLYVANIRGVEDGNHPWPGVVPFPHFEPGQFASACPTGGTPSTTAAATRQMEFNQPSTFVALNKNAAQQRNPTADDTGATSNDPALLNDQGVLDFKFSASGRPLSLKNDKSIGVGPLQLEGLTVVSRGQAYYHRPGNWAEQPNFFNPYWRPRLASVWQGRYAIPVVQQITSALPSQVNNVGQKILTH